MNYIKQIFLFTIILIGLSVQAQQTICTRELKTYIVDEGEASAEDNYQWSLESTSRNYDSAIENNTSNEVTIDWSNSIFDSPSGTIFTLSVVKTENNCSSEKKTFKITLLEGYKTPKIEKIPNENICNGDTAPGFHLVEGTPNATINYTITNSKGIEITNDNIKLNSDGNMYINYPKLSDDSKAEIFTLNLNTIGTDVGECGTLPIEPRVHSSITVHPIPKTSEIKPKN